MWARLDRLCSSNLSLYQLLPIIIVSFFIILMMGSLDNAVITGFICRLCSEMSRFVIHIYGEEGARMQLAKKINEYLPITVHFDDPLPKTVCSRCISKLELQHELIERCKQTNFGFHGRIRSVSNNC